MVGIYQKKLLQHSLALPGFSCPRCWVVLFGSFFSPPGGGLFGKRCCKVAPAIREGDQPDAPLPLAPSSLSALLEATERLFLLKPRQAGALSRLLWRRPWWKEGAPMRGSLPAQRGSAGMARPAWPPGPSTKNGAGRGREARPSLLGR